MFYHHEFDEPNGDGKPKFFIIIGSHAGNYAQLIINTNIPKQDKHDDDAIGCHYKIKRSECPGLVRDSWVNCSKIFIESGTEMNRKYQARTLENPGTVAPDAWLDIVEYLCQCKLISKGQLRRVGIDCSGILGS